MFEVSNCVIVDEEFVIDGDEFLIFRVYVDKNFNDWIDLVNGCSNFFF